MAKRAAPNEQPYRPLLDVGLVSAIAQVAAKPVSTPQPVESGPSTRGSQSTQPLTPRPEFGKKIELTREIAFPSERVVEPRAVPKAIVDKFDQEKRILFTRSETQAFDRLVGALASRLNAQVKVSHVIRALVSLALNAEGEIDKRAGEANPLVRPPNGDAQALQKFERDIARILASGLRDSGPIRD